VVVGSTAFGGSWPVVGVVKEFGLGDVCYVLGWGGRSTGEVSRIVEAGRGTEEKTPRPGGCGQCGDLSIRWLCW
jgi:hypothetical protein